jgi:hypothetical protein
VPPGSGRTCLSIDFRLGLSGALKLVGVVRHHHERWDGRGYPDSLAGDAIPLGARITAVADAQDAMTTDGPSRAGMPHGRRWESCGRARAFGGTRSSCRRFEQPHVVPVAKLLKKFMAAALERGAVLAGDGSSSRKTLTHAIRSRNAR